MTTTQNRSLTGTNASQSNSSTSPGFTFPARLVHPPVSQVQRNEDAVADRIGKLDTYAQQLGQAFGISFTSFTLNPLTPPTQGSDLATLGYMVSALVGREERIVLERRSNRWGLFFIREAALIGPHDKKADAVPLKDAPLDVRERFLTKSEEFFRQYLNACGDRLGKMQDCVAKGDRTLALLANIKLVE
jgi:hypothetical protein